MLKKFLAITFIFISLSLCGCIKNDFEVIPPPLNNFPTPKAYEETCVITGTFIKEKSFSGSKNGTALTFTSDPQTTKDFFVGDKGIVTYNGPKQMVYQYEGVLISCPTEGSGEFVVEHGKIDSNIKEKSPGKFTVIEYMEENCTLIKKNSVLLLDDLGNASVLQLGEDGTLIEKNIVIGNSNDEYYQVISGINSGEMVVVR